MDTARQTNQKSKLFQRMVREKSHPVRLTALLYLKQALMKEQYEMCSDLIAIAREFGAKEVDIQNLLEDPRRNPT